MPVDLPEQHKPREEAAEQEGFVFAAPILGWLVDVGSSLVVGQLLRDLEVAQPAVPIAAALFLTFVGGYSAAFIAGHREVEHAFVMGLLSFATTIALAARLQHAAAPEWYDPVLFAFTIPMAVLGGFLRWKVRPRGD